MPHENEPTRRDFAGCCTMIFSPSTWDNSESLDLSALGAIGWRGFRLGCPGQSEFVESANGATRRDFLQVPGFYVGRKREKCVLLSHFFSMEILCLAKKARRYIDRTWNSSAQGLPCSVSAKSPDLVPGTSFQSDLSSRVQPLPASGVLAASAGAGTWTDTTMPFLRRNRTPSVLCNIPHRSETCTLSR